MMQRYFFAHAVTADLDKQGRMVLPANLLETVGIEREVTVTGVYDHLEIWDRARWREHRHELEGSAEHVAERIADRH
jgi:MraZ protein